MPHGDMTVGINNMFFVEDVIGGYEGFVSLGVVLVRSDIGEYESRVVFTSCSISSSVGLLALSLSS